MEPRVHEGIRQRDDPHPMTGRASAAMRPRMRSAYASTPRVVPLRPAVAARARDQCPGQRGCAPHRAARGLLRRSRQATPRGPASSLLPSKR